MISRTSEYALRAMIYLAQNAEDQPIAGRKIAAETSIPGDYLSTVLGDLVRAGVLESFRGSGGGFRMARAAKDIRLSEVFAPFEPILADRRPCPFGKPECSDHDLCAGHDQWQRMRETYTRYLEETSVFDVTFHSRDRRASSSGKRTKR